MRGPQLPQDVRIELPLIKNEAFDCGPIALEMVLRHLNDRTDSEQIRGLVNSETSGVTASIGIALAAAKLGLRASFYTTALAFNPNNIDISFYQSHLDGDTNIIAQKIQRMTSSFIQLGGAAEESALTLAQIENEIRSGAQVIALLDWNKVLGEPEYLGHFVPITGITRDNILVHHSGGVAPNAQAFFPISKSLFDIARRAQGTDQDLIIIRR